VLSGQGRDQGIAAIATAVIYLLQVFNDEAPNKVIESTKSGVVQGFRFGSDLVVPVDADN